MRCFLILIALLVLGTSCSDNNNPRRVKATSESATVDEPAILEDDLPEALDENEGSFYKKRGYNLIEELYKEEVEKSKKLRDVESAIETLDANLYDSLEAFTKYDDKVKSYYNIADGLTRSIKDSVLREELQKTITVSLNRYKDNIAEHQRLKDLINSTSVRIEDLHTILKITKTLPLIEKYQVSSKPDKAPLRHYVKTADSVMRTVERTIKAPK